MVMEDFMSILFDGLGFGDKKPEADAEPVDDLGSELSYNSLDSVDPFA